MFDQPYYYNYDLTYRLLKKNAEEIVPSFSLIDFYNKELRSRIKEIFPQRLSVLELGSGQGSLFNALPEENAEVLGVDVSSTAIAEAQKSQGSLGTNSISYLCADACELKLGKKFQFVFDAHTLHCLCYPEERTKYLKSAFEHTADSGFFALETMVAHKRMDFEEGYYFREEEGVLYKEVDDEPFVGLRTFYGRRYMPLRSIRRSHEIEEELFKAGFKIVFFMVLSGYKVIYDEKRVQPLGGDPDLLRVICRKI